MLENVFFYLQYFMIIFTTTNQKPFLYWAQHSFQCITGCIKTVPCCSRYVYCIATLTPPTEMSQYNHNDSPHGHIIAGNRQQLHVEYVLDIYNFQYSKNVFRPKGLTPPPLPSDTE